MRIILCFLMALVAAPAWAEWIKVSSSGSGRVTFYIDPASIRKNGNLRKVWEIQDLKQRDESGVMSRRALGEYDCKEERVRTLAHSTHSEPMAGGVTLSSSNGLGTWSASPPDSASARILKMVCAPVAAPDLAKWVKVSETDTAIYYIDPASIRKNGNLRKVREIQDLKQRDAVDGEMSRRFLGEYDCKEERTRSLARSTHSDPMAGGVTLWSNDTAGEWSAIAPGSAVEAMLQRVCGK